MSLSRVKSRLVALCRITSAKQQKSRMQRQRLLIKIREPVDSKPTTASLMQVVYKIAFSLQLGRCLCSVDFSEHHRFIFIPSYMNSYIGLDGQKGAALFSALLHEADHIDHELTGTLTQDDWTEKY